MVINPNYTGGIKTAKNLKISKGKQQKSLETNCHTVHALHCLLFILHLSQEKSMSPMPHNVKSSRLLLAWGGLYLIWIAMTASLNFQELLTGLIVTLLIAWLTLPRLQWLSDIKLNPMLPWNLLQFFWIFLGALLKANIDMARRVVSPRLPINPAIVEIHTGLQSPLGRLLLANSITLTPGTLTVDVIDDRLQIHWIDSSPGTDLQSATRAIAEPFEKHLQQILL